MSREDKGVSVKKKRRFRITKIIGIILIIAGLGTISYPFFEIYLDKHDISKNINEWDKQKQDTKVNSNKNVKDDKKNNNVSKNKYPSVTVDGKDIIGKVIVKKTGEQIPILMGATEENLRGGATLYDNGIYPGENGTAIILGHRETTFGFLENIKVGDEVDIESLNNTYKFKVKRTYITTPDDESILAQKNNPSLTLVTCYPFNYLGHAPERFIVKLDLIN
ncbi:class D sortase [Clostridium sp.]|uniref:class D sortase n=1 Tax=Clostridium sp. TaxID=1506 RepID=UPI0026DD7631|nr:class D sortase [Clostridium sp.]MDO5040201.1 class D sortase [Clostridium sp.]